MNEDDPAIRRWREMTPEERQAVHDQIDREMDDAFDRNLARELERRAAATVGTPPLPTDIPLNCPYCGKTLANVPSDRAEAYYECKTDGLLVLPPDGRLRRVTSDTQRQE